MPRLDKTVHGKQPPSHKALLDMARAFVLTALVFLSTPAFGAVSDFLGRWVSDDPNTRGITRVEFRRDGNELLIHTWGKCQPRDCDWGEVAIQPFVRNVRMSPETDMNVFMAEYDHPTEKTMLIGHISNDGTFDIKDFTIWNDNTGRADYWSDSKFVRARQ